MIETTCQCGAPLAASESNLGQALACSHCGKTSHFLCAETLAEGSGGGDFDTRLTIEAGPQNVGRQMLIGGVEEITFGKQSDKTLVLPGTQVSRFHCKLIRRDFGPSRWEIQDNKSTNGLFVNGEQVQSQELHDGDVVRIGDYILRFRQCAPVTGPLCPSCGKSVSKSARICTDCGVDLKTGRSLVVSKGLDENDLAVRADTWIRALSWIIPIGLFPIASEAYGMKKPLATWVIFGLTVAASLLFLISLMSSNDEEAPQALTLMQWNGDTELEQRQLAELRELEQPRKDAHSQAAGGTKSAKRTAAQAEMARKIEAEIARREALHSQFEFHWYQLFTSALLHEPVLFRPFLLHLGGNMLFLLVFGLRVNELIGNLRTAIIYPLLAVASGLAHHLATMNGPPHPSLGASGAIMGLAGMYFVFFPAQRVHMAIWIRGGIFTQWRVFYKLFRMRGFWLLVTWIGLNDILPMFLGMSDSVAHWAHIGGFLTGAAIAFGLLLSRQVSALGGDVLSVTLGRRAWALVGRPATQLAGVAR